VTVVTFAGDIRHLAGSSWPATISFVLRSMIFRPSRNGFFERRG
jgi:hypothetical protein